MENRSDLNSILPFLPLTLRSSSLVWPERAQDLLNTLTKGPTVSHVATGDSLFVFVLALRESLGFSTELPLAPSAADGFSRFFDQIMSREKAKVWFEETVPSLARLLLQLPSLLECHYCSSDEIFGQIGNGLRILKQQQPGFVLLTQELISALLACALFCVLPTSLRASNNLPRINFDQLFAYLAFKPRPSQQEKIKCLVHYFQRICKEKPTGYVSFERKVVHHGPSPDRISYPEISFWKNSSAPLCPFKVFNSGLIEDQNYESLEVDFANKYLGGGALKTGAVQEEIRFMISPELIAGILFMPCMKNNESIEIIGAERFSYYKGYASSFEFTGNYSDEKPFDSMGRRKTRIIAIDALSRVGVAQYETENLLREANKAFCGFMDQSKYQIYLSYFQENSNNISLQNIETSSSSNLGSDSDEGKIGISTGNWGCGAFGGDPQIKSIIQWLATSQALRPFFHYYSFEHPSLLRLNQIMRWILENGWTVGELWKKLSDYSSERIKGETELGFFSWLVPEESGTSSSK
ncbi:hypothetical protein LUZ60_013734 [Juncus effusus]|nr:hypothetical protein LUZ60_013734 [Juncus effusus]